MVSRARRVRSTFTAREPHSELSFLARRRDTLVIHMSRATFRIAPALLTIVALGLALQLAIGLQVLGPLGERGVMLAVGVSLVCFAGAFRMIRRALISLATEAARLQELAIGWEAGAAPSAPSLATHDTS